MTFTAIGKIYLIPSQSIVRAFKKMPPTDEADALMDIDPWYSTEIVVEPNQYVMAIESNVSPNASHLHYQVLAKEGLVWIHNFDLITVDQKSGKPTFLFEDG